MMKDEIQAKLITLQREDIKQPKSECQVNFIRRNNAKITKLSLIL